VAAGFQDNRRFPQGQWGCNPRGLPTNSAGIAGPSGRKTGDVNYESFVHYAMTDLPSRIEFKQNNETAEKYET
jgi:hypothetical protein